MIDKALYAVLLYIESEYSETLLFLR